MDFNDSIFTSKMVSTAAKNEALGPQIKIIEDIEQDSISESATNHEEIEYDDPSGIPIYMRNP